MQCGARRARSATGVTDSFGWAGLSAVAAVWLTVLLVAAARRGRSWLWPIYAVALTVSIVLNVYVALMVVVHGVSVFALSRSKTVMLRWIATISHRSGGDVPVPRLRRDAGWPDLLDLAAGRAHPTALDASWWSRSRGS